MKSIENKPKLMIIVPNLRLGGQERVAVNTANILRRSFCITFIVFDYNDAIYTPEFPVIDLGIPARKGIIAKLLNTIHRTLSLKKLKRLNNIQYALSFGPSANMPNVLSKRDEMTIISIRAYTSVSSSCINRIVYKLSDKIICCSEEIRHAIIELDPLYETKTKTLYNPYDLDDMVKKGEEDVLDYCFQPTTIMSHGRLDVYKNFPRLIKAFSLVLERITTAQLLIVGDGPYRPVLENLISKLGLSRSVTLLGFRKNPYAYLSKSSLFVLSSFSEGFPNALVEGMVFLPVISADCKSGPSEILNAGYEPHITEKFRYADYGVLVQSDLDFNISIEINDSDRVLADAIISILSNQERIDEMRKKARERVKMFTYEIYESSIRAILGETQETSSSCSPG